MDEKNEDFFPQKIFIEPLLMWTRLAIDTESLPVMKISFLDLPFPLVTHLSLQMLFLFSH